MNPLLQTLHLIRLLSNQDIEQLDSFDLVHARHLGAKIDKVRSRGRSFYRLRNWSEISARVTSWIAFEEVAS